jgi:acyl-CoA synthetase (AMP-forming)/AMP-acid ligase II
MEALGFRVTHLYGATETYGPATSCVFQPQWNALPDDERFARMARQGVAYPMVEAVTVADPKTMVPVPRDGTTVGEIMVRSNTVMKDDKDAGRKLVPLGRSRRLASRRCDRDQGSLQGHHHLRRREYFQP